MQSGTMGRRNVRGVKSGMEKEKYVGGKKKVGMGR